MNNIIGKTQAAKYMKISLPTLNKFITEHKDILKERKIDLDILCKIINKESMKNCAENNKNNRRGR